MAVEFIFGIDPGNGGGVVALFHGLTGWRLVRCFKLANGEEEIVKFFREESDEGRVGYVSYLEKVHGWGEGRSFNFGMYYGFVRGVLRAYGIPIVDVTPQTWMKEMGIPLMKGQKALHRLEMRLAAGRVQDEVEPTNWSAAAILIGYYGIKKEEGNLGDK